MPRLEVELTSSRPDGSWTWRKAGAKQPKGEVDGTLVPPTAKVGDVLRVETEQLLDGIEITAVLPTKGERTDRFERIEMKSRPAPEQLVSSTLVSGRREGGDRRDRGDRPRRDRDDRGAASRRPERDRPSRPPRPDRAPAPERPKPKRIRPTRTHRDAVLESLAPELRPIAEQVLKGGVPAVRQALEDQNTQNRAAGRPEVVGDELLGLAEQLHPKLRAAEWRDRADAALRIIDEVDLRDLRSVVVAADSGRDDESRTIAQQLKDALARRVEEEHAAWIAELTELLEQERVVRALRVSSRPPKAGVPLPPELATRLTEQTSAALASDTTPDRWATVLDALSFAPVRTAVRPASIPEEVSEALRATVAGYSERLPHIAELFGIDPASVPRSARRRTGAPGRPAGAKGASRPGAKSGDKPIPAPPKLPAAIATDTTPTAPVEEQSTDAAPEPVVSDTPIDSDAPVVPDAPIDSENPIAQDSPVEQVAQDSPVEQVEQVEGMSQDEPVGVQLDDAAVPAGPGETDTDGLGTVEIVEGVADVHDAPAMVPVVDDVVAEPEVVANTTDAEGGENGAEVLGSPAEIVGEEGDVG